MCFFARQPKSLSSIVLFYLFRNQAKILIFLAKGTLQFECLIDVGTLLGGFVGFAPILRTLFRKQKSDFQKWQKSFQVKIDEKTVSKLSELWVDIANDRMDEIPEVPESVLEKSSVGSTSCDSSWVETITTLSSGSTGFSPNPWSFGNGSTNCSRIWILKRKNLAEV